MSANHDLFRIRRLQLQSFLRPFLYTAAEYERPCRLTRVLRGQPKPIAACGVDAEELRLHGCTRASAACEFCWRIRSQSLRFCHAVLQVYPPGGCSKSRGHERSCQSSQVPPVSMKSRSMAGRLRNSCNGGPGKAGSKGKA